MRNPSEGKSAFLRVAVRAFRIGLSPLAFVLCACVERGVAGTEHRAPIHNWLDQPDFWISGNDIAVEPIADSLDLQATLGVASRGTDIFVFDGSLMRITRMGGTGVKRGEFGREGDGPGEMRPPRSGGLLIMPPGAVAHWISQSGDSLAVFDGRRVQLFRDTGEHIKEMFHARQLALGGGPYFSHRMQLRSEFLLIGIEHQGNRTATGRGFSLWRIGADGRARAIVQLALPQMPTNAEGGIYRGPRQAAPLWDSYADHLVLSDGTSQHLLLGTLSSGITDTFTVFLPDRTPQSPKDLDSIRRLSGSGGQEAEPSAQKRIRQLALAPDGWIWIEPVQPAGLQGIEIIRVHPGRAEQVTDTLPYFPASFERPGSYLAIQTGTLRGYHVYRVAQRIP